MTQKELTDNDNGRIVSQVCTEEYHPRPREISRSIHPLLRALGTPVFPNLYELLEKNPNGLPPLNGSLSLNCILYYGETTKAMDWG